MHIKLAPDHPETPFRPWRPNDGAVFSGRFAFDAETTLIDTGRPWTTPTYVMGAACDGQRGYFVQAGDLQPFLLVHGRLGIVFHHAAFDLAVMQQATPSLDVYRFVDQGHVRDTLLLHRLWRLATVGDAAGGKGQSTLETCARDYLGVQLSKDAVDADGNMVRTGFAQFLHRPPQEIPELYLQYLAKDAVVTLLVFDELRRKIQDLLQDSGREWGYVSDDWLDDCINRFGPLTHNIQLRAAIVLREITANGLCIDGAQRETLAACLQERRAELRQELIKFGYLPGQPSATKALQSILREISHRHPDFVLPLTAKRGDIQTSEEALTSLKGIEPFIDALLEFRGVEKLLSTFVDKLAKPVVHPQFQPLVRSGRTSSFGEINAQNLPRDDRIRNCFVPSPGHVFITADYATLELATLASALENQFDCPSEMLAAINAGEDLHRLVAAEVFGKSPGEITKEERQKGKAINFGKPGGMGIAALRQYAKTSFGADLTETEAAGISEAWLRRFPEMRSFLAGGNDLTLRIAKRLKLTPGTYHEETGSRRFVGHGDCVDQPLDVLGGMLLKSVGNETPSTQTGRPYSEMEKDYFWSRLQVIVDELSAEGRLALLARKPSWQLRQEVARVFDRGGVFTLTGRLRADASFTARHNTVFQGLAADGAKAALWLIWRAGYRIVNFIHDEIVVEVPAGSNLALHEAVVRGLMISGMQSVVPGVRIDVEAAPSTCWSKAAFRQLDDRGKLVPCRGPEAAGRKLPQGACTGWALVGGSTAGEQTAAG